MSVKSPLSPDFLGIPPTQTAVIFGDSVTAQNVNGGDGLSAFGSNDVRGYMTHAQMLSGQRLTILNNGGVGGNTTTQMLARVSADALVYKPDCYIVVTGGDNDVTTNVPFATTTANLQSIFTQMLATKAVVVATTCLPTTSASTGTQQQNLLSVNNWIRNYCRATPGMALVDFFSIMADPTTPCSPASGLTYDGIIHPSQKGACLLGQAMAPVLTGLFVPGSVLPFSNSEPGLVLPNPRMTGNTAGVATSVTVSANSGTPTLTKTKVARADGVQGEWQQVVASGGTDFYFVQQQASTNVGGGNVSVGDRVYAVAEVEVDAGATMVGANGERPVSLSILSQDESGTPSIYDNFAASAYGTYTGTISIGRLILRTPNYLLGTGASRLFIRVNCYLNGTLRVGRVQVYKSSSARLWG